MTVGGVEPRALHRFLAHEATLSDDAWVRLLDDLLLPALPDDPLLLDALAHHTLAAGRPERAADALAHIAHRTPEQELHLVVAALRAGRPEQVGRGRRRRRPRGRGGLRRADRRGRDRRPPRRSGRY